MSTKEQAGIDLPRDWRGVPVRAPRVDELRDLTVFRGLDPHVVEWVAAHGMMLEPKAGDHLAEQGDVPDAMLVLVSGAFQFHFMDGERVRSVLRGTIGEATGLLPYSRMKKVPGVLYVSEPSRVLRVGHEHFAEMVGVSLELGQRLVATMSDRVRDLARSKHDDEKLMALGRLSAGLAHELNNPAAAVRRATATLRERLDRLPALVARMAEHDLTEDSVCAADRLRAEAAARTAAAQRKLSALERGEREDAIADWLDDHDVEESWLRAETLVEAGLTPAQLDELAALVPADALGDVVAWVEGGLSADRLLFEIDAAAQRITNLVASIKTYSHMDRSQDRQPVDVRAGIESTLTMLDHQLRKHSIVVERAYADDLPEVDGFPAKLNQVWTNLIDNAVDAMQDGGTLRIEAGREDGSVLVRIIDSGHGIPPELLSRIFEPFFTTKDVGEGTGLGLEIVERIIRDMHQGAINVESRPGRTEFAVRLPVA